MVLLNVFVNVSLKDIKRKIFFSAQDRVVSTASTQIFDFVLPSGTVHLDYHSPVIYLITCSRCSVQYVGKAGPKINDGLNWHKLYLKNPKYIVLVGYYQIISVKHNVKMLHI